jgi:hypothetical protein
LQAVQITPLCQEAFARASAIKRAVTMTYEQS